MTSKPALPEDGPPFPSDDDFENDLAAKGRGVLLAALVFGPALVFGEWAFRATLDIPNWEPLEVVASLAVITLTAAAGALAGDRLQALMRPNEPPDHARRTGV